MPEKSQPTNQQNVPIRVLLVEDNPDEMLIFQRRLERDAKSHAQLLMITPCASLLEAQNALNANDFDVLISDTNLLDSHGRETWEALRVLSEAGEAWQRDWPAAVRKELRQLLGQYVTYLLGRRPRLLPYLGE